MADFGYIVNPSLTRPFLRFLPPFPGGRLEVRIRDRSLAGWLIFCPGDSRSPRGPLRAAHFLALVLGAGAIGTDVSEFEPIPVRGIRFGLHLALIMAEEAAFQAARLLGIDPVEGPAALIGADTPAGRDLALLVARRVRNLRLYGSRPRSLQVLAAELKERFGIVVRLPREPQDERIVFLIAGQDILLPRGSLVLDLFGRRATRDGVETLRGGLVEVPGMSSSLSGYNNPVTPGFCALVLSILEGRPLTDMAATRRIIEKYDLRLGGLKDFSRPLPYSVDNPGKRLL